jgi:hypothetical protein
MRRIDPAKQKRALCPNLDPGAPLNLSPPGAKAARTAFARGNPAFKRCIGKDSTGLDCTVDVEMPPLSQPHSKEPLIQHHEDTAHTIRRAVRKLDPTRS